MWTILLVAYIATWLISWTIISLVASRKYNVALTSVNYHITTSKFMQGKISIFEYLKYVLFNRDEKISLLRKLYKADEFMGAYAFILSFMCWPLDLIGWLCVAPVLLIARAVRRRKYPTYA